MKTLHGWDCIPNGTPRSHYVRGVDRVHLRIFNPDDPNKFYGEVHTAGCCFERIQRNPNHRWESCYFYCDKGEGDNMGFVGGDSRTVRGIDEDIKTVKELAEYLEEYAIECNKHIDEMCKDYNEKRKERVQI